MQQLVDFIVEKEIARRVKSGALCGARIKTNSGATKTTKNDNDNSKLSPAAQKVLDDAYRRAREGNITQVTPVKQASTVNKSGTIPASWKLWDAHFNGRKQLEQPTKEQLKEASVSNIPAS